MTDTKLKTDPNLKDQSVEEDLIEEVVEHEVSSEESGTRLDVYVADKLEQQSRSFVQKLISDNNITVSGKSKKANYKVKEGENIVIEIPVSEELSVDPEPIPLDIVYEDKDVIVVNKPQGMVVHPAPGHYTGTMVNALLYHCKDLSGINGIVRPGIVHRLDKDTSGIIMVAKNDNAHQSLAQQIKNRSVTRKYMALVNEVVSEPAGIIDAPIGRDPKERKRMAVTQKNSKQAITKYWVKERFENYTLVECKLETGRTHQIRVHMSYLNHPVVGDPLYGRRKNPFSLNGQLLHAYILGFNHPITEEYLEFEVPLPDYFTNVLDILRK